MKILYQAADRVEAQLLKDHLASFHIETLIQGEYLSGGTGELPALQFPVLWVLDERDLERGRNLIDDYFQQRTGHSAWRCSRCGEDNEGQFAMCWNCGTVRD